MGELYNLSTFLTASGLATAVALLWTQLWFNHAEEARKLREAAEKERESWEALFGLAWAEMAVITLLVSFGWAIVWSLYGDEKTSPVAIGLFIAGLVMTVIGVSESLLGAFYKLCRGDSIDSALERRRLLEPGFKRILWLLYALLWVATIGYFAIWAVNGPEQARPYHEVIRRAVPVTACLATPLVILVAPLVCINPKRRCKTLLIITYYAMVWTSAAVCASLWVTNRTGESPLTWSEMIHSLPVTAIVVFTVLLALPILVAMVLRGPEARKDKVSSDLNKLERVASLLEKLASLRDNGIITEEEFQREKKRYWNSDV